MKRRLPDFVLSNCTWQGGSCRGSFAEPSVGLPTTPPLPQRKSSREGLLRPFLRFGSPEWTRTTDLMINSPADRVFLV
jgi:hypothetical protein